MRTLLAPVALAVCAHVAAAQTGPDDRYAKLITKPLVEGVGFPGIVEVGGATPAMYKALGPGREDPSYVFWYFYDRGPWRLTVIAETTAANDFQTRAIEIAGAKAPATSRGIHIGDSAAQVTKAYGASAAFTGTVGDAKFEHMTTHDLRDGSAHVLPEIEAGYKGGMFYPALGTLFVLKNGAVERIVVMKPAPKTAGASLGLLLAKIDRYDAKLEVAVNGMPVDKTDNYEYPRGGGDPYIAIPRYVLHKGTNTLHVAFSEFNPKPQHELDIALVEFAKLEPQTVAAVIHHIAPAPLTKDQPFAADYTFEVTGDLPRGSFETAKVITADAVTEVKLKAAASALAKAWGAAKAVPAATFRAQGNEPSARNFTRYLQHPKLRLDARIARARCRYSRTATSRA